jgi:hypothetical protein
MSAVCECVSALKKIGIFLNAICICLRLITSLSHLCVEYYLCVEYPYQTFKFDVHEDVPTDIDAQLSRYSAPSHSNAPTVTITKNEVIAPPTLAMCDLTLTPTHSK